MGSESQHEETCIKSVFTILGIYSRWRTTRIWRQGIYMVPVSVENLHSNRGSRNFWCDFFSRIKSLTDIPSSFLKRREKVSKANGKGHVGFDMPFICVKMM